MRQVEAGDLNVAIKEQGFREARSVSVAFNHMIARIRALMDQIVQEQEKKRLYELNALQAQINPHFLYNTLDSIIWMEERGRSREAITMVSALARLFRISISKGRSIITVREELEHVRNYLIIQKMRFKDQFTYEIEAQEETLEERTVKLDCAASGRERHQSRHRPDTTGGAAYYYQGLLSGRRSAFHRGG